LPPSLNGESTGKKKTAKFLTQDGKLVEIDLDKLPSSKKPPPKKMFKIGLKNKP
jgi:hypothetical protein